MGSGNLELPPPFPLHRQLISTHPPLRIRFKSKINKKPRSKERSFVDVKTFFQVLTVDSFWEDHLSYLDETTSTSKQTRYSGLLRLREGSNTFL